MKSAGMTPEEMARLHEIMFFRNTCVVKVNAFGQLAHDERLKKLLEQDITAAKQQLQDIQNVLKTTMTVC